SASCGESARQRGFARMSPRVPFAFDGCPPSRGDIESRIGRWFRSIQDGPNDSPGSAMPKDDTKTETRTFRSPLEGPPAGSTVAGNAPKAGIEYRSPTDLRGFKISPN